MYRLNTLQRPVLITVDEVVAKMASEGVPDLKIMLNSIEVAEEKYIVPVLGADFYEAFIEAKNLLITVDNRAVTAVASGLTEAQIPVGSLLNAIEFVSQPYKDLWYRYLWKICAEAVDAMSTVPGWLRHTAQGQQKHNPAGFTVEGKIATGSRDDVQYKMDVIVQGRISPLVDGMYRWIQARADKYPLHPLVKDAACGTSAQKIARKAGFVMGVYDDKRSNYDSDVNG